MSLRWLRATLSLVRPTLRARRWIFAVPAGVLAAGVVFLMTRQRWTDKRGAIDAVHLSMVILALGSAFLLDDPSEETVAGTPTPLWIRRAVRIAVAAPLVAAGWLVVLRLPLHGTFLRHPALRWPLTLEFGALVAFTIAAAAIADRLVPDRLGGVAAGPVLLAFAGGIAALPSRFALFVHDVEDQSWARAHVRWWYVLAGSLFALGWGSLDRGRAGLRRRLQRRGRAARSGSLPESKGKFADAPG